MRTICATISPEVIVREVLPEPTRHKPACRLARHDGQHRRRVHAKDLLRALHEVGHDFTVSTIIKVARKPVVRARHDLAPDQL